MERDEGMREGMKGKERQQGAIVTDHHCISALMPYFHHITTIFLFFVLYFLLVVMNYNVGLQENQTFDLFPFLFLEEGSFCGLKAKSLSSTQHVALHLKRKQVELHKKRSSKQKQARRQQREEKRERWRKGWRVVNQGGAGGPIRAHFTL